MIDHIYLPVSDLKRSSEFYKKLLEPLGIDMPYTFDRLLGFAIDGEPGFWLKYGEVVGHVDAKRLKQRLVKFARPIQVRDGEIDVVNHGFLFSFDCDSPEQGSAKS